MSLEHAEIVLKIEASLGSVLCMIYVSEVQSEPNHTETDLIINLTCEFSTRL